jgi:hypothetical protein
VINSARGEAHGHAVHEMHKLRHITPKYFGAEWNPELRQWQLTIENLCAFNGVSSKTASFLDFKVGTEAPKHKDKHLDPHYDEDVCQTHAQLGFCVAGYLIKDSQSNTLEAGRSVHDYVQWQKIPTLIHNFLLDDDGKEMQITK